MFDLDRWQEIWLTITRNKMRSMLTAFGVFWGIFMLVVMSGAGYGLQNGVMAGMEGFAENSAFFFSGMTSEPYKGYRKGRYWNMASGDLEMLRSQIPEIRYISPILFGGRNDHNTVRGDKSGTYSIKGLHPMYNSIEPQRMLYGRYLNDIDIQERRKVCLIGRRIYEELFLAGENPLGQLVRVDGIFYQVVGVCEPVTNINIGGDSKESVVLPFTVMQQTRNRGDHIDCIAIAAKENVHISDLEKQILNLLKIRHSIAPDDPNAVQSMNVEEQFLMFRKLCLGIHVLIWVVGLGTLLAGVVGVSNIMMVTVRERTREIGIRRALGAKPGAVLMQIMNESLVLTFLAGFFGLAAGVGLLSVVDQALMSQGVQDHTFFLNPQIPFSMAVIAAAVLVVSGLLAGVIPAYRALQIKAIDAIREE